MKSQKERLANDNEQKNCNIHENEEIGDFFCFTCNSISICLQCLVQSLHKNHEIMSIDKAQKFYQENIQVFMDNLSRRKNFFVEKKLRIEEKAENVREKLLIEKQSIEKNFHLLNLLIEKKKEEVLNNFQEKNNQIFQEILLKEKFLDNVILFFLLLK